MVEAGRPAALEKASLNHMISPSDRRTVARGETMFPDEDSERVLTLACTYSASASARRRLMVRVMASMAAAAISSARAIQYW